MRWVVVMLVACSSPRDPVRPAVPGDAAATADAAVAPDDPPEPKAPVVECAFERSVFCVAGLPTRTALQKSPFEWCSRTQPAREQSFYKLDAQFSAVETRARRKTQVDACCYVDFFTRACD